MKAQALRQAFLDFFARHGHTIVPSSSLVPGNDPSLLFTNAGMVQFKEVFLGMEARDYVRATSSQRCVRAGGKHNDLENVGYTARHHTFFEMLGNFSFGDYFKREAIAWAWAFLTEELGLPKERLWVTVYEEDAETEAIWLEEMGIDPTRFSRCGEKDNFWSMGDTGPCGPCTEIFYDHGPEVAGGPPGSPDEDGDRYIEIWNLVFMQFNRDASGELTPLPKPSVDTGMGLERIAAVLQGVHSNYEIDLFQNLIAALYEIAGRTDLERVSAQVIADHIRSCSFLIADGVTPSNEGRGYVLRRIIRRAARHGRKIGFEGPFFYRLVPALVAEMGEAFPELAQSQSRIETVLKREEERFGETLEQGLALLEAAAADGALSAVKGETKGETQGEAQGEIPGEVAFRLFDTYGFPIDLTADFARERGLTVDMAGFEAAMAAQRERARGASQFAAMHGRELVPPTDIPRLVPEVKFVGYEGLEAQGATVIALYQAGAPVERVAASEEACVVLDTTPFYGESGGQVGDTGRLVGAEGAFEVSDTQKPAGLIVHCGRVSLGALAVGDRLTATVDGAHRTPTRDNHTATHLLHAALRNVLGTHVQQKGSLVASDRLRFDFSHDAPVSDAELAAIETQVNTVIQRNIPVEAREMGYDEAIEAGAMALFGEKYGDRVRVLSVGDYSVELCGGTHVARTGDIGLFKVIAETGVASGVRRIEAVTGQAALAWYRERSDALARIGALLKVPATEAEGRVATLLEQQRELTRQVEKLTLKLASGAGQDEAPPQTIAGVKLVARVLEVGDANTLRQTLDQMKDKLGSGVVVLGLAEDDKVRLVAGVTRDLTDRVNAADLVNHVAAQVGGRGGGRADMAQAGGTDVAALGPAIESASGWLAAQLGA